jgi:transcriptional regulator with XRE-family HTH domain
MTTDQAFRVALGRGLRLLRTAAGLSQHQLAAATGIHHTVIGRIERGQVNFGISYLRPLAQALDITPDELVPTSASDPVIIPFTSCRPVVFDRTTSVCRHPGSVRTPLDPS